ncbi:hypothetical protein COY07_02535 [Candidatus Peregrinibacteria bacterium CG_4_10_14_0_2_um_filter_43_11]|nr:MAG: hypothetical protein COY07_02535 [Candidatus Peregrinibacteria bacterium CG_4_10_14_0_2_um_filter_43_11]
MDIETIIKHHQKLTDSLPEQLRGRLFLSGGTAALIMGSDRPFSNDLDFMAPETLREKLEDALELNFSVNTKKPVFHSLAAHGKVDEMTFDVILESVVKPDGQKETFTFHLTPELEQGAWTYIANGYAIKCVPRELLIVIKLLAGRGKEWGKYDLYDAECLLKKQSDLDEGLFRYILKTFGTPKNPFLSKIAKNAASIDLPPRFLWLKSHR